MSCMTDCYYPLTKEDHPETGIPCFNCHINSGIDCPGRKPDEATLCYKCFEEMMKEEERKQIEHLRNLGYDEESNRIQ